MTPLFDRYIAPARAYPQLWRLVLGLAIVAAVYFGWLAMLGGLLWVLDGLAGLERRLGGIGAGNDPVAVLLLLTTFLGMGAGAWAAARLLHRRGLRSLTGRPAVVLRDFVLGAGVMVVLAGVATAAVLPLLPPLLPATPVGIWLQFLPLALVGLLVQTGAEEVLFRGYLMQQLAARFRHPLVWMGLPALLFGLAHMSPDQTGLTAGLVVAATGLFGLIAADLTVRTGALGLAWGIHFVNNVFALLIISSMGGLGGLALFRLPPGGEWLLPALLVADMVLLAMVWGVCRLWLNRR